MYPQVTYLRVRRGNSAGLGQANRRPARRIGVEEGADFEGRREIILREAARAFNENGVQQTSLVDVATRLGVTKPALYHYVPSKGDLIRLCLENANQEISRVLDEASALDDSGLAKLKYVAAWWTTFATTDFGRAIVLIEKHALTQESREKHLEAHRTILHRIENFIAVGIEDGSIRQCKPAIMTLGLMGIFNSPARWFRSEGSLGLAEVADELIGLMEHGVTA